MDNKRKDENYYPNFGIQDLGGKKKRKERDNLISLVIK